MGFNKKLGNLILESSCSLFIGDRGSGKSTLMALAAKEFIAAGKKYTVSIRIKEPTEFLLLRKKLKLQRNYYLIKIGYIIQIYPIHSL